MLANNETGILFPVEEIARIVKENSRALVHVDGVNAVGKIPLNLKETAIDLLVFQDINFTRRKESVHFISAKILICRHF